MVKLIPNILTAGRLPLTVVFLVMILYSPKVSPGSLPLYLDFAFVLFVVTGLTDIIDGIVARKYDVTSKFGRMLDPLVDKVLICGAFICFAIIGQPRLFEWPATALLIIQWSVAGIITIREVFVTILRHTAEARGINFSATAAGKIKMFVQSFVIGTVIIKMAHVPSAAWGQWFTTITLIIMVAVTTASVVSAVQKMRVK